MRGITLHKFRSAAVAAFAAVALVLTVGSGVALAYEPANQYVCEGPSTGPCLTHGVIPQMHTDSHANTGNDDKITTEATGSNVCGADKVTSNCPFDVGSGYNTTFQGDDIVCLHFANSNGFIGANGDTSPPDVAGEKTTCGGSNGYGSWIVVHGSSFVDIKDTDVYYEDTGGDHLNYAVYLHYNTPTGWLLWTEFESGKSNWGPCSSGCG